MVRGRQKEGGGLGALFTAVGTEEEEEEEEEESLFKADAVNEEDSERDRATERYGLYRPGGQGLGHRPMWPVNRLQTSQIKP